MLRSTHRAPFLRTALAVALCAVLTGLVTPTPAQATSSDAVGPSSAEARPAATTSTSARSGARRMIKMVNTVRASEQTCGDDVMPAVRPLKRNKRLQRAAQKYARLMARRDYYSHDSPDGSSPGDRISATGYTWSKYGENIAAGYDSPKSVLAGWLASPGHCRNLMGRFRHLGFGHGYSADSTYGDYWVQDFASPR